MKDFIDNWEVNVINQSATHSSGLEIFVFEVASDGSVVLGYNHYQEWIRKYQKNGINPEIINAELQKLQKQFLEIYKNLMN